MYKAQTGPRGIKDLEERGEAVGRGYFYKGQSEQFVFYRIPKTLFTDPEYEKLTISAKTLYGILLDRESLSDRNGWIDDKGRIFIYMTNRSICKSLNVSDKTATKLLVELERIDLIRRVRQGLGKPTRIYVMNFLDTEGLRPLNRKNSDSEIVVDTKTGTEILRRNKKEMRNDTDSLETNLIESEDVKGLEEREKYKKYFTDVLEINVLKERHLGDADVIDEIMELILDTMCSKRKTIGISGEDRPINVVKGRFMELDSGHLEYVLQCLSTNTTEIKNIRKYLLATLFNSVVTINSYYKCRVNHDMASGII